LISGQWASLSNSLARGAYWAPDAFGIHHAVSTRPCELSGFQSFIPIEILIATGIATLAAQLWPHNGLNLVRSHTKFSMLNLVYNMSRMSVCIISYGRAGSIIMLTCYGRFWDLGLRRH
jgi:hypothetical protein